MKQHLESLEENPEESLENFREHFLEKCQGIIRGGISVPMSDEISGEVLDGIPGEYMEEYLIDALE